MYLSTITIKRWEGELIIDVQYFKIYSVGNNFCEICLTRDTKNSQNIYGSVMDECSGTWLFTAVTQH